MFFKDMMSDKGGFQNNYFLRTKWMKFFKEYFCRALRTVSTVFFKKKKLKNVNQISDFQGPFQNNIFKDQKCYNSVCAKQYFSRIKRLINICFYKNI